MGIGVVQLDQGFVARLEAHRGKGRLDFENGKSLLSRGERSPRGIASVVAVPPRAVSPAIWATGEHAEIVANSVGITGTVAITQLPSGALPDRVVADLGLDLGLIQ